MLCCVKNRRCKSSRVTSPLNGEEIYSKNKPTYFFFLLYYLGIWCNVKSLRLSPPIYKAKLFLYCTVLKANCSFFPQCIKFAVDLI